jgi:hypothetical protein
MTPDETARLLAFIAAFDQRTVGRADVLAWHDVLGGYEFDRCTAAVRRHFRESTDRLMPAHVVRLARTTTDGDASRALDYGSSEHGSECPDCRLVHHRDEPCDVLERRPMRELTMRRLDDDEPPPPPPDPPRHRESAAKPENAAVMFEQLPPPDTTSSRCQCGAIYLDYPSGRDAHVTVFGHFPFTAREAS